MRILETQTMVAFVVSERKKTHVINATIITMKGPRQREASQPATDPNLRPPGRERGK